MSFIFSRALVEEFLLGKCSGTDAFALLNGSPMPQAFLSSDKTKDFSRLSRFGMTYAPLMGDRGKAALTSWLAGFHAKTSALQGKELVLTESDPACGKKWRGLLAKLDPALSEWRTVQHSLLEDWGQCLLTFPRSGMTADGWCWELKKSEPPISGIGSGSLLPTLTVCGNYNRKGASPTSGDGLATALKKMPTLCARDFRHPGRSRMERTGGSQGEVLPQIVGGPLNPTWCEWFMGFPRDWTELRASEMPKSRSAQPPHSECLPLSLEAEAA